MLSPTVTSVNMAVRCELAIMKSNRVQLRRYYCGAIKGLEKFAELSSDVRNPPFREFFLWIFGWKSLNHLSHMVENKWYQRYNKPYRFLHPKIDFVGSMDYWPRVWMKLMEINWTLFIRFAYSFGMYGRKYYGHGPFLLHFQWRKYNMFQIR